MGSPYTPYRETGMRDFGLYLWWAFCVSEKINKIMENQRFKLPIKDRVFWLNFFQCLAIFVVATALLGFIDSDEGGYYSLLNGYLITSFFAVIILCGKIAEDFADRKKK